MMYTYREPYPNELMHYGILGMKWGVRRFQNEDGSLTDAGRNRYSSAKYKNPDGSLTVKGQKKYDKAVEKANKHYNKAQDIINNDTRGRYSDYASKETMAGNKYQAIAQSLMENKELRDRAMQLGEKFTKKSEKEQITAAAVSAGVTVVSVALAAVGLSPFAVIAHPNNNPYKYADRNEISENAKKLYKERKEAKKQSKEQRDKQIVSTLDKRDAIENKYISKNKEPVNISKKVMDDAHSAAEKYLSGFGEHVGQLIRSDPANGVLMFSTDRGIATVELDKNGKPLRVGYDD